MAAELEKLAAPGEPPGQAEAPEPEAGDGAGQFERETTADENPEAPPRLSGWCQGAAMWSRQHPLCRSKACGCRCHEDGWERPPVPEGARLSKFSTDHDKKETP